MDTELSRALTRNEILSLEKLKLKWKELSVEVYNQMLSKNLKMYCIDNLSI